MKPQMILTLQCRRWDEFARQLVEAIYINDRYGFDEGQWLCDGPGPWAFRHAKRILHRMGRIDVSRTIQYFRDEGTTCDCEILFYIDGMKAALRYDARSA